MTSQRKREASLRNLEKAHEKMRSEGPTPAQREASKRKMKKINEKLRSEGPTPAQLEATRRNVEKAHEKMRAEGPTPAQREASRRNIERVHEKRRLEGPTPAQREAFRRNVEKAHEKMRAEGPTPAQLEAWRRNIKKAQKTSHERLWREKRYAVSLTDSIEDADYFFTTTRPLDVRQIATDIAKDEFSRVNRSQFQKWKKYFDDSKIRSVRAYVWVSESYGSWESYGIAEMYYRPSAKYYTGMRWYDYATEGWYALHSTGAVGSRMD